MHASVWVENPGRAMKVKIEIPVMGSIDARTRPFVTDLRLSMHAGTRKMVNYA